MKRPGFLLSALAAVVVSFALVPGGLRAQIVAGDVAIVAYSSDTPDAFAWVALTDIPSNTVLNFTDSSVSNGLFRWDEHLSALQGGPLTWTHSNDVIRGTVISLDGVTTNWSVGASGQKPLSLSISGDQIFCYTGSITQDEGQSGSFQGDPSGATMVYGINFGNDGWTTSDDPTLSVVPSGLSTGAWTAVHINDRDNGYYGGSFTGSVDQILEAIADPDNWVTSDAYIQPSVWPTEFDIFPGTLIFEFSSLDKPRRYPHTGRERIWQ